MPTGDPVVDEILGRYGAAPAGSEPSSLVRSLLSYWRPVGHALGLPKRVVDVAANYYASMLGGLPAYGAKALSGEPIPTGELVREALFPEEEARRSYPRSAGRAVAGLATDIFTDPLIGGLSLAARMARGGRAATRVLSRLGQANVAPELGRALASAAKTGRRADIAGRAAAAAFLPGMVEHVAMAVPETVRLMREEGLTPPALETGLEAAGAGLFALGAGRHALTSRIPKLPAVVERPDGLARLREGVPTFAPEPDLAQMMVRRALEGRPTVVPRGTPSFQPGLGVPEAATNVDLATAALRSAIERLPERPTALPAARSFVPGSEIPPPVAEAPLAPSRPVTTAPDVGALIEARRARLEELIRAEEGAETPRPPEVAAAGQARMIPEPGQVKLPTIYTPPGSRGPRPAVVGLGFDDLIDRVGRGEISLEEAKIIATGRLPTEAPLKIRRAEGLDVQQAEVQERFAKWVEEDPNRALAAYVALPESEGGKIISADVAKDLSPDYIASSESRAHYARAVQRPSVEVSKMALDRAMARPPAEGERNAIVFLAGGPGAGKTSARRSVPGVDQAMREAKAVFDATLSDPFRHGALIDRALASGNDVTLVWVYRDPVEAWQGGVIPRGLASGRMIPAKAHAETHAEMPAAIRAYAEKYRDHPNFQLRVIDNSRGPGGAVEVDLGILDRLRYDRAEAGRIEQALSDWTRAEHAAGRIPDHIAQGAGISEGLRGPRDVQPPGEPAAEYRPAVGAPAQRGPPAERRPVQFEDLIGQVGRGEITLDEAVAMARPRGAAVVPRPESSSSGSPRYAVEPAKSYQWVDDEVAQGRQLFARLDLKPKESLRRGVSRPWGEDEPHTGLSGFSADGGAEAAVQALREYWHGRGGVPKNHKLVWFEGRRVGTGPDGEALFAPTRIRSIEPASASNVGTPYSESTRVGTVRRVVKSGTDLSQYDWRTSGADYWPFHKQTGEPAPATYVALSFRGRTVREVGAFDTPEMARAALRPRPNEVVDGFSEPSAARAGTVPAAPASRPLTLEDVRQELRGQEVAEVPEGFAVTTKGGLRILLNRQNQIVFNPEVLERAHGPETRSAVAAGRERVVGRTQVLGQDVVVDVVDRGVLPHELAHVFEDHFATASERVYIRRKFEARAKTEGRSYGEVFADAYRAFREGRQEVQGPIKRLFQRITDLFYRAATMFGIRTEGGLFREMESGRPFGRTAGGSRPGAERYGTAPPPAASPPAAQATLGEKALEVWRAGLVSGPGTLFVQNPLSNLGEAIARAGETAVAGILDPLLGGPRARFAGEARYEVAGALRGAGAAAGQLGRDIVAAFRLGPEKYDPRFPPKIGGTTGRLVRIPYRLLRAFDDYFGVLGRQAEIGKLANRYSKGNAATAQYLIRNPTPDMVRQAERAVTSRLFQDPNKAADLLNQMTDRYKFLNIVVPFKMTPTNIASLVLQRSPVGFVRAAKAYRAYREGVRKGLPLDELTRLKGDAVDAIARPLMGTMLLGTFGLYAKAGGLTGSGPQDQRQLSLLKETGWQPYSFVIPTPEGKAYLPFNRFEPVSSLLGFAADMAETDQEEEAGRIFEKAINSFAQNLTSKTYLQGLADALELISQPRERGASYLAGLAGSVVPTVVAKAAQAVDPILRDVRPEDRGLAGVPERAAKVVASRIPGLSQVLPERRSATGERIERPGTAATRFLLPVQVSRERPERQLEALMAAVDYSPPTLPSEIKNARTRGATLVLTDREKRILEEERENATERARRIVAARGGFLGQDAESTRKVLERLYQQYGERARARIYALPEFRRRAREAARATPRAEVSY